MSKKLAILLVVLISQAIPFIKDAQALGETISCTNLSVGITYGNPENGTINEETFFPENSANLTFEFTITNTNILNGKEVYLHLPGGVGGSGDIDSRRVIAAGPRFQITVDGKIDQAKRGTHEGNLYWPDPDPKKAGQFKDYCSQIKYQVGIGNECKITVAPDVIKPNTSFGVQFLGLASTEYSMLAAKDKGGRIPETITNSSGLGTFQDITLIGTTGQKPEITISSRDPSKQNSCKKTVKIDALAPDPPNINPKAPIIPISLKKCDPKFDKNCTSAGGKDNVQGCNDLRDPNDSTKDNPNPGIATAIGCIHTNPVELAKDILTFLLGIGGGLAFLMMLLGAFQMITSSGNPETLAAGRSRLTSAVIGLLFIIFTILLLQIIGANILNLPGFEK